MVLDEAVGDLAVAYEMKAPRNARHSFYFDALDNDPPAVARILRAYAETAA